MSEEPLLPGTEVGFDRVLAFTLPERDARGRIVRLGPVVSRVLASHAYPPLIRDLLAEALVLTALLGSLMKDEGSQLTIQAQTTDGPVELLVCDYRQGELRGYVNHDAARVAALPEKPNLTDLFGKGFLAITFDLAATEQRYQGVVPLEGASLAAACEAYFALSEQVPTLIRVGTHAGGGGICTAGGLLVQHLPEGEEGRERLHVQMDHPEWEHVSAIAGTMTGAELTDAALSLDALLWRLFHEEKEVRVHPGPLLTKGCRCTEDYYRAILARFPEAERAQMRNGHGVIEVDCAFCARIFPIAV